MIYSARPKNGTVVINNQNGIKATVIMVNEEGNIKIMYHDERSLEEALGNSDMLHKEDVITEGQKQFWDELT